MSETNNSEVNNSKSTDKIGRPFNDLSNGCYGCGCGLCLGFTLMFIVFVLFMVFSPNPPFTQMDIAFDVVIAAGAGGILGGICYPLFQKRRKKRN